jgi:hypothetical protein
MLRRYQGVDERGLGSEPTPELYLENLLACFREVWRVLREDGCLFVNLGDTRGGSAGGWSKGASTIQRHYLQNWGKQRPPGYDVKMSLNLYGIPERFALAMQAEGWIWRDTIIWHKKSPMPESVGGTRWERCRVQISGGTVKRRRNGGTRDDGAWGEPYRTGANAERPQQDHNGKDFLPSAIWADCPGCPKCTPNDGLVLRRGSWRCTDAWEHIFMFVKGQRYWTDGEAVKTPHLYDGRQATKAPLGDRGDYEQGMDGHERWPGSGANRRNVWSDISPEPYAGPHYATFPPKLPRICIQASTSEAGVCPGCGGQWARVMDKKPSTMNIRVRDATKGRTEAKYGDRVPASLEEIELYGEEIMGGSRTLSWRPTCACPPQQAIPATILDPFCGTGTTLLAAQRLGRRGIGVDLSEPYLQQAIKRLTAETLPLPLGQ